MDGMHDLGGREGFGPVDPKQNQAFKHPWEVQVHAIGASMLTKGWWNADEQRHAIERMDARHYVRASYYERQLTAFTTLLIEKGLASREELEAAAGGPVAVSLPSKPGRTSAVGPWLPVGTRVRVKAEFPSGHTRFPAYVRGKCGIIVAHSAICHFPDAAGHALESPMQMTYDLRFEAKDLWPDSADNAQVHFTAFHSYLDVVEE